MEYQLPTLISCMCGLSCLFVIEKKEKERKKKKKNGEAIVSDASVFFFLVGWGSVWVTCGGEEGGEVGLFVSWLAS